LGWFVRHLERLLMQRRRYLMRYVSEDEPAGVIQFSALLNVRLWHEADELTEQKVRYEQSADVHN
jgi:hypothetical protein